MSAFVGKRKPNHLTIRERAAADQSSEFLWGPYALTCPSCGAQGMPKHFDFCGQCGSSLQPEHEPIAAR
jgi:hypothetical protein